tara:strand:+ start:1835 stop:1996 length:162 start_codon:yes stop_codon:yes gene_type:complete
MIEMIEDWVIVAGMGAVLILAKLYFEYKTESLELRLKYGETHKSKEPDNKFPK